MMKLKDIFTPPEETALTDEEKITIGSTLMIDNKEIWRVQRKYFYRKINDLSRKMATCSKEELPRLQDKIQLYGEIMNDHEHFKQFYLKKNKNVNRIKKVRDFFYYVTNQDIKDQLEHLKSA